MFWTNNKNEDNAIVLARKLDTYKTENKCTLKVAAENFNISYDKAKKTILFLKLEKEVQIGLENDLITAKHASELIRINDRTVQIMTYYLIRFTKVSSEKIRYSTNRYIWFSQIKYNNKNTKNRKYISTNKRELEYIKSINLEYYCNPYSSPYTWSSNPYKDYNKIDSFKQFEMFEEYSRKDDKNKNKLIKRLDDKDPVRNYFYQEDHTAYNDTMKANSEISLTNQIKNRIFDTINKTNFVNNKLNENTDNLGKPTLIISMHLNNEELTKSRYLSLEFNSNNFYNDIDKHIEILKNEAKSNPDKTIHINGWYIKEIFNLIQEKRINKYFKDEDELLDWLNDIEKRLNSIFNLKKELNLYKSSLVDLDFFSFNFYTPSLCYTELGVSRASSLIPHNGSIYYKFTTYLLAELYHFKYQDYLIDKNSDLIKNEKIQLEQVNYILNFANNLPIGTQLSLN